jgi:arylformamidase
MRWVDVSMALRPALTVWPGDPPVTFDPVSRVAAGDSCNVSLVSLNTHAGTHCDAPWHFEDAGKRLHEVDSDLFFGDALVVGVPAGNRVTAADLPPAPLPPRLLLRTRSSLHPEDAPFDPGFCALTLDAADRLVEEGVRLVGIDSPSIAPHGDSGPVHHRLLRAEVFIVENLRLAAIPPGTHPFVVLPMPLHGADGAPCRAFIGLP